MDIPYSYTRLLTREVKIGGLAMGAHNPIRVQSMTNTPTLDTKATVEQVIRLVNSGCELVRITAPGLKEAENLAVIRDELRKNGYRVPLIADIHFNPQAAELAAGLVNKIRINPGNYADKKKFEHIEYTGQQYREELEKIASRLYPLLKICKENGTAIRIGTNHGSLSDRIMSRYGDTPRGMAESALEFIRICAGFGFHDLVLSMKSSNIRITTFATRLLVCMMQEEGFHYPVHLGLTEAGGGEDGRTKSAAGIGSLLEEGIGDTIRVSLTEEPEKEMDVARILAGRFNRRPGPYTETFGKPDFLEYFSYQKRDSIQVDNIGGGRQPVVVTSCMGKADVECHYFNPVIANKPDYIYDSPGITRYEHPKEIGNVTHYNDFITDRPSFHPLLDTDTLNEVRVQHLPGPWILLRPGECNETLAEILKEYPNAVLILHKTPADTVHQLKTSFRKIIQSGCRNPVLIRLSYTEQDLDHFNLCAASDAAFLLTDGLGDGLWLDWIQEATCKFPTHEAFNILQAMGDRLTRTDFIACPSCGRTQFNIQEVLAKVKEKMSHLVGLKIAIMGCIVNGPGEMADAHYGYVGAGPGKVNLYKGKNLVKRGIDESTALEALISLIKENGDWQPAA
ncbi:MAG: (E)-4-hydroxy-3-methylbut-2-enyl-diphosphate synthase [Bacteroidetes bacterium]|nr:(E)-4-hydroxy-3-methylbut-2-enyl-diphosphate synthase [Bacteroidota bacterium]